MIHFETPWYKIETENNYTRIVHKNVWNNRPFAGVVILPFFEGKLVLLDVYRQGTYRHELEFPRGCSEPSSSPEENAKRELQEEMGSTIVSLEPLGTMIADTAWGTGDVYLFFAEIDAIKKLQKEENIESYILVSPAEFLNLVANNTIQDGFTLATFTKALAKGLV